MTSNLKTPPSAAWRIAKDTAYFIGLYAVIGATWAGILTALGLWSVGWLIIVAAPLWLPVAAISSSVFLYPETGRDR